MEKIDENILKDIEKVTNTKYESNTDINDIFTNLLYEIEKRDDKIKELDRPDCEREYNNPRYEYGY